MAVVSGRQPANFGLCVWLVIVVAIAYELPGMRPRSPVADIAIVGCVWRRAVAGVKFPRRRRHDRPAGPRRPAAIALTYGFYDRPALAGHAPRLIVASMAETAAALDVRPLAVTVT